MSANELETPRFVLYNNSIVWYGYCDASLNTYGSIRLLCSKTRETPVKVATITGLELLDAVSVAELLKHVS